MTVIRKTRLGPDEQKEARLILRELRRHISCKTTVANELGTSCAVVSRWYLGMSLPSKESFEKIKATFPYLLEIIHG